MDEITGVERAADGQLLNTKPQMLVKVISFVHLCVFPISEDLQGHRNSKTAIGCQQALISFIFLASGLELQVAIYR